MDNGEETMMSLDAIYYHATQNESSSMDSVIRTHHCIFTVINFETTNFDDNLLCGPIPQYVYLKHDMEQHNGMTYMTFYQIRSRLM